MVPLPEESEEPSDMLGGTTGTENGNDDAISIETNPYSSNGRTITVSSEPEGANVYVDGELKGVTPYMLTLDNGTYDIRLEKVGYDTYKTNIILDGSNDQSVFLYPLIPKQ